MPVADEKKTISECFCHPVCCVGLSLHKQTSHLVQLLEGHRKAKWDWWGFTLKYHAAKHSAAVQQLLQWPGRGECRIHPLPV